MELLSLVAGQGVEVMFDQAVRIVGRFVTGDHYITFLHRMFLFMLDGRHAAIKFLVLGGLFALRRGSMELKGMDGADYKRSVSDGRKLTHSNGRKNVLPR